MYYIGIDLGGTNIAAGVVNDAGKIVVKDSIPTGRERDVTDIIKDMADLALKVTKDAGLTPKDIKSVGIGCPGTVDSQNGIVVYANNLKMDKTPVSAEFRKVFDVPVYLENDANAAAYGEYVASGEKVGCYVFMTLGTGVGGGIILDGKIYRGFNCAGGEIGHTSIVMDGKPCTCGRRGCFEAYASVTALIEQTKEKMAQCPDSIMHDWVKEKGKVSGRTAFDCAKQGDKAATEVRDTYIRYVAEGMSNIINIFQPEMFVIGGGISKEGDVLLKPIKEYVDKNDYNRYMPKTRIEIAKLFGDAGIVGAALSHKE